MDTSVELGLERIQRAALLLMVQNLSTAIAAQNTVWSARDATFYSAMGRANPGITVENIAPDNMYPGTIPSLIDAPIENYPNLCSLAYIGTPQPSNDDWGEMYSVSLIIEVMVKSIKSEEEVNARIQRTLEAVNSVLKSNDNRRLPEGNDGENLVTQISRVPLKTIGEVFVKHQGTDPNARWYHQGGSLTYQVDKFSRY